MLSINLGRCGEKVKTFPPHIDIGYIWAVTIYSNNIGYKHHQDLNILIVFKYTTTLDSVCL
jgi:hypothetical protein